MSYRHILAEEGITEVSVLPMEQCRILRPYLLGDGHARYRSAILFLVPYRVKSPSHSRNLSEYAVPRDYHAYMKMLFERILPRMRALCGDTLGFADHSPIDERDAAVRSGLGVIGKNGLLINERYGTYVFIGELITEATPDTLGYRAISEEQRTCLSCGACLRACATGCLSDYEKPCLSAITQKKGELTEEEGALVLRFGCAWGCDLCQSACPMNAGAEDTPIPFFKEERIERLSSDCVRKMDDEAFKKRAFAWRGRETVLRNLLLLEENEDRK